MPYCSKCGFEVDEDAKFCPSCGTPTQPPVVEPEKRDVRRPLNRLSIIAITLIVVTVVAAIIVVFAFMPVRPVDVKRQHSVPQQIGVDKLNLAFTADVAHVRLVFEDLTDEWQSPAIILSASATAKVGVFVPTNVLDQFFHANDTTVDNVLTVTSQIDVPDRSWPGYSSLNVTCDIRIDLSMNTTVNVKTSVGKIVMDAQAGVILSGLSLEATTGGVEADLKQDTVITGDISIEATTGGIQLSWDNVNVTKHTTLDVATTTGGIELDVEQDEELLNNVTINVEATTGGIDFTLDIRGNIGSKVASSTSLGAIDINRNVGFSGDESLLESDNYPAGSNFDVTLKATVGGIEIDVKHTP